jgi:23S rRNA (uracil1939-C5)-methyltransferase
LVKTMAVAKIEKPTYGLEFEATTPKGEKILVPFTAVGELWEVEHLKGNVYKPLKPLRLNGGHRREPPCGYFPTCFNCQWMHLKPEIQTQYKLKLFEEFLGFQPDEVLTSPSELSYRVRAFLYHRGGKWGFRKSWIFDPSRPLLEMESCPLLPEPLNKTLSTLRKIKFPENLWGAELLLNPQKGEIFVKLLFLRENFNRSTAVALAGEIPATGVGIYRGEYRHWERIETLGRWETAITLSGFTYLFSPDCFLQPNYLLWEKFLSLIKPLGEYRKALELHAGIGFFTLPLSRWVEELESSDLNCESSRYREINLKTNGISNVRSFCLDALKHAKIAKDYELLVVDPPRGGLTRPLIEVILKRRPREIIYISCNLRSLKKDWEILREVYRIERSALLDQFPNTYHTESVLWLKLKI